MSLLIIFLSIAIFQGVVLGFILLKSPFFKSKTNQYLASAIFSISWSLLNLVLDDFPVAEQYSFLRKIVDIVDSAVLFPVLILFFVLHQVDHPQKHDKKLRWLFMPFLLTVVHSILDEIIIAFNVESIANIGSILSFIILLITLYFIPYIFIKTYKSIQYSKNQKEQKWLTYLWGFEVAFLGLWLLAVLISPFIEYETLGIMRSLALFTTLMIHWVAYSGVYKLKLANEQEKIRTLLFHQKSQHSTFIPEKVEFSKEQTQIPKENAYYQKLEQLCITQKIYRDSNLDRNVVAQMLGISPNYVSQIVNSVTEDNFTNYINRYRVEDVKRLILDKEFANYSLVAIGLECGFSSKTTFHNTFKKMTGMTPNSYRKKHQ